MGLDDIFAYETQKIVRIRDRRLGFLFYGLQILILCYVIGFQILYSNGHFVRKDVRGIGRITIQQPTKQCNPNKPNCLSDYSALQTLPYCKMYTGDSTSVSPEHRQNCVFADQHTLTPFGMLDSTMFIPTRIDSQVETRGCVPGDDTCDNEYNIDSEPEITYIADIERYTVMLVHTFHRDNLKGNSGQMQGYYYQCDNPKEDAEDCSGKIVRKPIECINDGCAWVEKNKKKSGSFLQERSMRSKRKSRNLKGMKQSSAANRSHTLQTYGAPMPDHSDKSFPHVRQIIPSVENVENSLRWKEKFSPDALSPAHHGTHSGNQRVASHDFRLKLDAAAAAPAAPPAAAAAPPAAVPGAAKPQRKPPTKPVFAINEGDIFSIQEIFDLCGLDLDKTFNSYNESIREAGTVIEVAAIYDNLHAWISSFGFTHIEYTYKFSHKPMEEMKTEMFAQAQPNFPQQRIVENRHGIYLNLKIAGQFGFFSIVYMLIMLTTALGLLAVAKVTTDFIALKVMENKEEYAEVKYENTKDIYKNTPRADS